MKHGLWDFSGGVHPPEHKHESTGISIRQAPIPQRLVLPLQQHIGKASEPLVNPGDKVLKGECIAEGQGFVSASLHAPTSGTVVAIERHAIPHPSGLEDTCIVIAPDGEDRWAEHCGVEAGVEDYQTFKPEDLLKRIRAAGIAGLGGAGFPTEVKLKPNPLNHISSLIINAAECEPYITADDMLMRERAQEVIQGILIVAHIINPDEILLGIEDNKPEAIASLQVALKALNPERLIKITPIPVKYPSGGEKQLIQILTGMEVPNGGIPADIGLVCQNVGTCAAIYRAIIKGEPLISRVTTLTGAALETPCNVETLIGTPISTLLEFTGLQKDKLDRLVMGGPMMGFSLTSDQLPVVKTTNCILASGQGELTSPNAEQACIRCGICAEACPVNLLPQQLYWYAKSGEHDKALGFNLLDCIECGACAYVCPSNIPLVQYYRHSKGEIRQQEQEHSKSEHARLRFESRKRRLEQEAAEKEAKRKARAEAAAQKKQAAAQASSEPASTGVDSKAAVIQAALARVEAKKAESKETEIDKTENEINSSTPAQETD